MFNYPTQKRVNSGIIVEENTLVTYVNSRVVRNKNFILIVNGETGSGKTYWALFYALLFAKFFGTEFTIKDNVSFTIGGLS